MRSVKETLNAVNTRPKATITNEITDVQQRILREHGVISKEEVAVKFCDVVYAENVLTGGRRIVKIDDIQKVIMIENSSNKRVLLG